MKIALLGYGKMGKMIDEIANKSGYEIVATINSTSTAYELSKGIEMADVVIEFSRPDSAYLNISNALMANTPVVSGTTGMGNKLQSLKTLALEMNSALFYSSNFSVGMYIFTQINQELARFMNAFNEYEVSMIERHHKYKIDSPSGTAIDLANAIIDQSDRLSEWSLEDSIMDHQLQIKSIRKGGIIGDHQIIYDSAVDSIQIAHHAKTRFGFAMGALRAAEFIIGKTGCFGMQDLVETMIKT